MLLPQMQPQSQPQPLPFAAGASIAASAAVLPLQRSTTASPWAVVQHHAARRLVFAEYDNSDSDSNRSPSDEIWQGWERLLHWKDGAYSYKNNNNNRSRRHRHLPQATATASSSSGSGSSSMPLSNCHSLLYTTNIEIGSSTGPSQPQSFQVQFDLEGTDLWVLSADCDDTCSHVIASSSSSSSSTGYYDAEASETSQPLYNNDNDNFYETGARNGNQISGTWMQDTVALTSNVVIPKQGFVAVNHVEFALELEECRTTGAIGFGPTKEGITDEQVVEDYATVRAHLGSILSRPMFSLYLTDVDDYPVMDPNGNDDGAFHSTATASSELVLGGIKSSHYTGCLTWHDLQFIKWSGDEQDDQYLLWNLALTRVSVVDDTNDDGDDGKNAQRLTDLPNADTAILVTDAMLGAGNAQSIGLYAKLNNLTCAIQVEMENAIIYDPVECDDELGLFDVVYTERCSDQKLYPLEIAIQNADSDESTVYKLGKDVLLIPTTAEQVGMDGNDTEDDDFCLLGLLPIPNVDGFLLGEGFLRQFYAVFDFGEYKIGLAPRADNDPDVCPNDADLDISSPPSPPSDSDSTTPAPTPADTDGDATESPAPTSSSTTTNNNAESNYPTASATDNGDADGTPLPRTLSPAAAPTPPTSMMPPSGGGMMPPHSGMMQPSSSNMHQPTSQQGRPYPSYNDDNYTSSSTNSNDNGPLIIPLLLAGAVGLVALVVWRSRRVRYQRAAYFDDMAYRMGDMELREIY